MIRILDEALRTNRAQPYLEMPDNMMNKCIVGNRTSVGQDKLWPYIAAHPFHIERDREKRRCKGFSTSTAHLKISSLSVHAALIKRWLVVFFPLLPNKPQVQRGPHKRGPCLVKEV